MLVQGKSYITVAIRTYCGQVLITLSVLAKLTLKITIIEHPFFQLRKLRHGESKKLAQGDNKASGRAVL